MFKMSLPVRGAWIEITAYELYFAPETSLPVRGAWIEMLCCCHTDVTMLVAPRAGSVD